MPTWTDYKNHVRKTNPDVAEDIDEVTALSKSITSIETINNISPTGEHHQTQTKETNSIQ